MRLVKERIPTRFGFDPKTDIQVLSPMNRSLLGARNLNQVLQTALNPGDGGPEVLRFGWTFRIGDLLVAAAILYTLLPSVEGGYVRVLWGSSCWRLWRPC